MSTEQPYLETELQRHDRLYHQEQNPEITDAEYDLLKRSSPGPAAQPGYPPSPDFPQAPHPEPMLSLANAFNHDEFLAWHARAARALGTDAFPMTAELKIDGIALRLEYRQGALTLAATRGDGATGENVTAAAATVSGIPKRLDPPLPDADVRGEVYLPISRFADLNRDREADGLHPYANPRNAAAGAVRQHDVQEAAGRGLKFWAYSLNRTPGRTLPPSHRQALDELEQRGFPVNPETITAQSPEAIAEYFQAMLEKRETLDYHADGIVVKADLPEHREILGATSHEPRWAIAWKFPAERRTTTLNDIRISIGRFGKLTPVAVLEPVAVGGVTVQSASLHNEDYIKERDIRPGDRVIVERAGDVIPRVLGPVNDDPLRPVSMFRMPESCPACEKPATRPPDDAAHWCLNPDCPSRLPETLKHFVSKNSMDIDGLGEQWCQALIDSGLARNPADLYFLTKEQLTSLDRMGERLAARILGNIEASKEKPLDRVLYSLGIFRLGRSVSRALADAYGDIAVITTMDEEELAGIEGIGPAIAESVIKGLRSPRTQETLDKMAKAGVRMMNEPSEQTAGTPSRTAPWAGLNFVVTGRIEGMTRPQAEQAIRERGGNATGSVTKNTHILVAGDKPGSKLAKARQTGARIIGEREFADALQNPNQLLERI